MEIEKEDFKVITQNYIAMKENQESTSKVVKIEIEKLNALLENLNDKEELNLVILKEINKTINSLIMYEWMSTKKIEAINDFYNLTKEQNTLNE